jgi:single-strand DNA-binding protein
MASFNKVILMGNLTRDPQLRYLPSNMAVCDFGLAVNRRWRDKDGNMKEDVCFVDVAAFGKQGETINQYMAKGRSILIEGHLRLESWTGQDGQKRSKHSVTVENFQFVGPRGDQAGGGPPGQGAPYSRSAPPENNSYQGGGYQGSRAPAAPPQGRPAPVEQPPPPEIEDLPPQGDEIPF